MTFGRLFDSIASKNSSSSSVVSPKSVLVGGGDCKGRLSNGVSPESAGGEETGSPDGIESDVREAVNEEIVVNIELPGANDTLLRGVVAPPPSALIIVPSILLLLCCLNRLFSSFSKRRRSCFSVCHASVTFYTSFFRFSSC